MSYFKDPAAEKFFQDFIHENFGSHSCLHASDYYVHIAPDLAWHGSQVDFIISAGTKVQIAIRFLPNDERLLSTLKRIFRKSDLRQYLRNPILTPKENSLSLFAEAQGESPVPTKHLSGASFKREILTAVKLTDLKSKKVIVIEVSNGTLFDAQERALKELYGDRLS